VSTPFFLTVCLNPVLQKTVVLPRLWENEVNRSNEYYLDASGKGINTTRILHQLGERVTHLTVAGGRNRELFAGMTRDDGLDLRFADSNSEIRFCTTLINTSKNTTTEIVEEAKPVVPGTEEQVLEMYRGLLPQFDVVIISGSKAAGFSGEIFPKMVRMAKTLDKYVALDYRGEDLLRSVSFKPDIITPNITEFAATFFDDVSLREYDAENKRLAMVKEKVLDFYRESGIVTVLTRGKYGVLYLDPSGPDGPAVVETPSQEIVPRNTIGSGDAFTAGFTSAYVRGDPITTAVEQGQEYARRNAKLLRPGVIY